MSQLTVDIVARVNDTLKKLGATEAQIQDINATLKQTKPAAAQATAAMNDLGAASTKAGTAARGSSAKFFQAGQAISDFSVAGIRGAANNLEFLALQLGIGGPLLLGIALATSALVVFGDDIAKALDPIGTKAKEVEAALRDVLDVIENEDPDLLIFEEQIPEALEQVRKDLGLLREEIRGTTVNDLTTLGTALAKVFNFPDQIAGKATNLLDGALGTSEQVKAASELEGGLQRILGIQEDITAEAAAEAAARGISVVQLNELQAETIRLDLERLGLGKQLEGVTNTQLLKAERAGKLDELILKLQEKKARAVRDEVSELEKAKKKAEELAAELERRRSGEIDTLDALRDQTTELNKQIAVVKKLNEARREQAERDALFGAPQRAAAAGTQVATTADILQSLNNARQRAQEEQAANTIGPESLRGLPEGVEEDVAERAAEAQRMLQDEFAVTLDLADQLAASINLGLSDSLITLSDAFGTAITSSEGFDGIGNTVLLTLADLAGNVGRIAIGTGIAIEGIKKALETLNPFVAIGAGVALVALSAAVKSKLANAAGGGSGGNFYGGSGGGGGTAFAGFDQQKLDAFGFERLPNGAVIPAGSLQPPPPVQAFQPLAPSGAQTFQIEGELVGEGETLRAIVRNTDKRVSSTRGVAA